MVFFSSCHERGTNKYDVNESDPRSNVHYLSSSEIRPEKIQACTGFELMTSAISVQRSTN